MTQPRASYATRRNLACFCMNLVARQQNAVGYPLASLHHVARLSFAPRHRERGALERRCEIEAEELQALGLAEKAAMWWAGLERARNNRQQAS